MNNNLFHYTSLNALQDILKENQLRLNRIDKVKDSTELKTLNKILNCCFKKYSRELEKIDLNSNLMTEGFLAQRSKSYIFCASHCNENDYLWRKYANGGNGVCIEFDRSYFPFSSGRGGEIGNFPNKIFVKVEMIYGEKNFIKEFELWLHTFINNQDNSANRQFLLLLSTLTDCYKTNNFKKENEVRIVYFNQTVESETKGEFFSPNYICKNSIQGRQYIISGSSEYLNYKPCYGDGWGIHHSVNNIYVRNFESYEEAKRICNNFSFTVNLLD